MKFGEKLKKVLVENKIISCIIGCSIFIIIVLVFGILKLDNVVSTSISLNEEIINFAAFLVAFLAVTVALFIGFVGVDHYLRFRRLENEMKMGMKDINETKGKFELHLQKCQEWDTKFLTSHKTIEETNNKWEEKLSCVHNEWAEKFSKNHNEIGNRQKEIELIQKSYFELVCQTLNYTHDIFANIKGDKYDQMVGLLREEIIIFQTYSPNLDDQKNAIKDLYAQGSHISLNRLEEIIFDDKINKEIRELALTANTEILKRQHQ